jgi:hypothetical protein
MMPEASDDSDVGKKRPDFVFLDGYGFDEEQYCQPGNAYSYRQLIAEDF